jgi:AIPR protein
VTQLKAQFRDCLLQFSRDVYKREISGLSEIQRSDALTLCYITKIFNQKNPGLFPDDIDELRFYITDGPGDRGADFIFKSDSNVYIFQSKFRSRDSSEKESDFDHFRNLLARLCPETGSKQKKSQKVLDLISDIDFQEDQFTLIFLSLAKPDAKISLAAETGVNDIQGTPLRDINARCDVQYISESDLNSEYREALSIAQGGFPAVELLLSRVTSKDDDRYLLIEGEDGKKCYLAALSAGQIHQLYQKHRGNLFNLNIRNYVGDTRTNKEIMATAKSEADNFFYYNNGLSAIAKAVTPSVDSSGVKLRCTDFSIINGAQTFRSVSKAHSRDKVATQRLRVPIRITEFDFAKRRDSDFLEKITRFNNTQNAVRISDFRSNDPVQTSIARYIGNVDAFGGKKFSYKNKRSQQIDRSKIFIGLDEFCRTIHAFFFGPADVFGGLSYLYDTAADKGYPKLFGEASEPLAEQTFKRYFGAWLLCSYAAEELKKLRKEREEALVSSDSESEDQINLQKNALERKYHVYFALGEVIREVAKQSKKNVDDILVGYAKPKWKEDAKRQEQVGKMLDVACDMLVHAYEVAQSKSATFVHRNFFRSEDTLTAIRNAKVSRMSQLKSISL